MILHESITTNKGVQGYNNFITNYCKEKFDYSKAVYYTSKTKIEITCLECGTTFWQTPDNHKTKDCIVCATQRSHIKQRRTSESFTIAAKNVHGELYDYSKVHYINNATAVEIVCPEHGSFWQTPINHINKSNKCPDCQKLYSAEKRTLDTEEFITRAQQTHGDRYSYIFSEYTSSTEPIKILCHNHGVFTMPPAAHIAGSGCKLCGLEATAEARSLGKQTIIKRFKEVHKDLYDYSLVQESVKTSNKVDIICKIHGVFKQSVNDHLRGCGCPSCNSGPFNPHLPTRLYYLEVKHEDQLFYKIGITTREIDKRFSKHEMEKITILQEVLYSTGTEAYSKEQIILQCNIANKYYGPPILDSGNTEILTKPVNIDIYL